FVAQRSFSISPRRGSRIRFALSGPRRARCVPAAGSFMLRARCIQSAIWLESAGEPTTVIDTKIRGFQHNRPEAVPGARRHRSIAGVRENSAPLCALRAKHEGGAGCNEGPHGRVLPECATSSELQGRPRREDQRSSEALPTRSGDEGSSEKLSGSCASGAACGARTSNGRSKCDGGALIILRPAATRDKRTAAAAMK